MTDAENQPFLGLSWTQLIAGSLAAMTSAWLASTFGVSGTIVGAAIGSLSASIATALYLQSLARGEALVRRPMRKTSAGSVVTADEHVESTVSLDDNSETALGEVIEDPAPNSRRNRQIIIGTLAALVVALLAIGAFEFLSGNPFGQADRPAIGRPWQPAPSEPAPAPTPGSPSETPATPTPSPTQEVTPEPTTSSPSPTLSPEVTEPTPAEPSPEALVDTGEGTGPETS